MSVCVYLEGGWECVFDVWRSEGVLGCVFGRLKGWGLFGECGGGMVDFMVIGCGECREYVWGGEVVCLVVGVFVWISV